MPPKKNKAQPKQAAQESSSSESGSRSASVASSSSGEEEQQQSKRQQRQKPVPKGKGGKAAKQAEEQQQQPAAAAAAASSSSSVAAAAAASSSATPKPVTVIYCPISTWPAEMCEYTGNFAKCKQWHLDNAELLSAAEQQKLGAGDTTELGRKQKTPGLAAELMNKVGAVKELVIDVRKRMGRKRQTFVKGLEYFGQVNLAATALAFKKRFSCGCGVIEAPSSGLPATIEIQGDVCKQLLELLPAQYGVDRAAIKTFKQGKPWDFTLPPGAQKEPTDEDDDEAEAGGPGPAAQ